MSERFYIRMRRRLEDQPLASATLHEDYIELYCHLDGLIWRNLTALLSITGLLVGVIGAIVVNHVALSPLSESRTVGAALLTATVLYVSVIFTLGRMRGNRNRVEDELRRLEPEGYFRKRPRGANLRLSSATSFTIVVFSAIAAVCGIVGAVYLALGNPVMDRRPISTEDARDLYGMVTNHEQMPNGELRFRLMGPDGDGYIRTVAVGGGWQNSHFHKRVAETYIVEKGWMAMAVQASGPGQPPRLTVRGPGGSITTPVGQVHDVYLPDGAVIHTVKHGAVNGEADWNAAPAFDAVVQQIGEAEMLKLNHAGP